MSGIENTKTNVLYVDVRGYGKSDEEWNYAPSADLDDVVSFCLKYQNKRDMTSDDLYVAARLHGNLRVVPGSTYLYRESSERIDLIVYK